tara:strand:- start:31 stop:582 length:552 start_codon:yes stop_codon:yes gene_type:complete
MEATSHKYKATEDGFGELTDYKKFTQPLRIKFNKSNLTVTPRNTHVSGLDQHFYSSINELVAGAEMVIKEKELKVEKRSFVRHKFYNFLMDLYGKSGRITYKTNTNISAIIDQKTQFFQRPKDENILIILDRVDGFGRISLRKKPTSLISEYFPTYDYSAEKKSYAVIQDIIYSKCQLTKAKF